MSERFASECGDCHKPVEGEEYFTEVNPHGGYGRNHLLVCDSCMRSGRWDDWIERVWPNWPERRTYVWR